MTMKLKLVLKRFGLVRLVPGARAFFYTKLPWIPITPRNASELWFSQQERSIKEEEAETTGL